MAAGARAHLAFQFRVGQILVVLHVGCFYRRLVVDDDAGACRKPEPLVVRRAHVIGQAGGQHFGFNRLEQARLFRTPQASGIDSDQYVGRTGCAFILEALDQRIFARFDAIQLDAGGFGELAV